MKSICSSIALLAAVASAWDVALRDAPIVGDSLTYLDGTWDIDGAGFSLQGSVPGDLFSDLENAKVRCEAFIPTNTASAMRKSLL